MDGIKQGNNFVTIVGKLKEKKLEIAHAQREGKPATVIRGEIVVQTSEFESHTIKVFTYDKTKDGKASKAFHSLRTCMEEYASLADGADADTVTIKKGSFDINEYFGQNGLVSRPQYSTTFISRSNNVPQEDFIAEFSVDLFVTNVRPEVVSDEETGRLLVDALLPMYGGKVAPFQLICADQEVVDVLSDALDRNMTTTLYGDIVSKAIVVEKKIGGFGKQRKETSATYVNELVVTGGTAEFFTEEDEQGYKVAEMKKAMAEREIRLEEMKNKPKGGATAPAKLTGFGKAPVKKAGNDDMPW